MFTGIVQAVGAVRAYEPHAGGLRLTIDTAALDLARAAIGDSIAVAGVCLTAVALDRHAFSADVSRETLSLTTIDGWRVGQRVNLEPALRAGDPLGGHLVSGHVDGVAVVTELRSDARSPPLTIETSAPLPP